MRLRILVLGLLFYPFQVGGQERLPIIDMHLHAFAADAQGPPPVAICTPIDPFPAWDPRQPYGSVFMAMLKKPPCPDPVWSPAMDRDLMQQTVEVLERLNIIAVASGTPERVATWRAASPLRLIPGFQLQIDKQAPSVAALRDLHKRGELAVLGEVVTQYQGIAPDDPRLEPYWALAEELDIPVAIHVGPGPPGVIYLGSTGYRARLHSALTLEEVLVRHPKLRVNVMHAGYPMLEDLLALLYAHPQVYADLGVIAYTQPRAAFYRYLQGIVEAGWNARHVRVRSDGVARCDRAGGPGDRGSALPEQGAAAGHLLQQRCSLPAPQ